MLMDQAAGRREPSPVTPPGRREQRHAAGYNAVARLAAGRVEAFAAVADYLRGRGPVHPRHRRASTSTNGLAVLEDFGDDLFARLIEAGEPTRPRCTSPPSRRWRALHCRAAARRHDRPRRRLAAADL